MDSSVWLRVMEEAEAHSKGRAQQWLVDRLCEVGPKAYTIQRVQNWKSRGVPRGEYPTLALALGKSIDWVAGVESTDRRSGNAPPRPPADFSDRRAASESGWSVLEDLAAMPAAERDSLVADIHGRAENYRTFLREAMQRMTGGAAEAVASADRRTGVPRPHAPERRASLRQALERHARESEALESKAPPPAEGNVSNLPARPPTPHRVIAGPGIKKALQALEDKRRGRK